jgi:hypothetical protein
MCNPVWLRRNLTSSVVIFVFSILAIDQASAHVKWFCAFDVAGQPLGLENVLCPNFEVLVGIAVFTLIAGCILEYTSLGEPMLRSLDRVTGWMRTHTELLFRVTCASFFLALWFIGGVLLTPELKTASPIVPWLQLVMALGLLSRRTMPLTAFGICVLYAIAIRDYGIFHLVDYPVFLGIAAYLALTGMQKDLFGMRPLDVVRWAAAIMLMWASIEKWAYPQWSFPLFIQHPAVTMGFDDEFFMRAAGVVEFTLSFALLWTPLVRRCAATILCAMFISAIFEFGVIDAVGHSCIIVVLVAIVADNARAPVLRLRQLALAPVGYAASLIATLALYYLMHTVLFGTSIT